MEPIVVPHRSRSEEWDGLEAGDFEHLHLASDPAIGLRLVVAIHSTTLRPAAGGPYGSEREAIDDALRLASSTTRRWRRSAPASWSAPLAERLLEAVHATVADAVARCRAGGEPGAEIVAAARCS